MSYFCIDNIVCIKICCQNLANICSPHHVHLWRIFHFFKIIFYMGGACGRLLQQYFKYISIFYKWIKNSNFSLQKFANQKKQTQVLKVQKVYLWVTHVNCTITNQLKLFKMFFQQPTKVFEVKFHMKFGRRKELIGL